MFRKILNGTNCSLIRFKKGDKKLEQLIFNLFNDRDIEEYLNPDYLKNRTPSKIRKWISGKTENPVEVWYVIKWKNNYIGYVCFKWRKHFDEACEISTAIEKKFRGLKLGFESSKILVDYILTLNKFKYIVGYVHYLNLKAANNLKKIGFRKASHLQKTVTVQFYNDDGTSCAGRKYRLYCIFTRTALKKLKA